MFAFILATALATVPAPAAAQPAMDCTQSTSCATMAQMNMAECSMASMPGMNAPVAKSRPQSRPNDLYSGRK